jgi:opacity protein-like surface antigen
MIILRSIVATFLALTCLPLLVAQQSPPAQGHEDPSPAETVAVSDAANRGFRVGRPDFQFGRVPGDSKLPGYPLASFSYLHQFEADFDSSEGNLSFNEASLWAPVLPAGYDDLYLFVMLGYRYTEFDTSVVNVVPSDGLHTIRLPIVLLNDCSEDWFLGAMVMPTFAGDLSSDDGFYISAAAGGGRSFGPHLRVLGGIYYSHIYGEETVIPGIMFSWRPAPDWELYFYGPMGGISYRVSDDWILSLSGRWNSPEWNVQADSRGPGRDIELSGLRVGLKLEGRLYDRIWGFVTGGVTILQEMKIEDESGRDLLDEDIDSAVFVRTGLNFRF